MYSQEIVIGSKNIGFTSVSNSIMRMEDYHAIGLYTYLLSLPENWRFHKNHLESHGHIGKEKLQKLLKKLEMHNLITIVQIRDAQGRFSHLRFDFNPADSFKFNDLQECTPLTEKPSTAEPLPVLAGYKINKEKRNINTKETLKILSASDDAQSKKSSFDFIKFEEFWKVYPKKKNRIRTQQIWKSMKCNKIAETIITDVKNRILNEAQWQNDQFIPHPSTYLNGRRWEDEISLNKVKSEKIDLAKRVDNAVSYYGRT